VDVHAAMDRLALLCERKSRGRDDGA